MIEFRILGPLEVEHEGRLVPLGGTRQRAVLAILLLHRGEVVSTDRLVDELWGERPPDTATKTVQVYVSRLRKELGQDLVLTRGGGYVLELEPAQLDAERFERLAGDGRAALERGEARQRERAASPGTRPVARPGARGSRVRAARTDLHRPPRGAQAGHARAAHRGRSRARAPRGTDPRAGDTGARASGTRAAARPADPRALPLRPPGGRAGELPRRPARAHRGTRHRAKPRAPGIGASDPRSGPRDRRACAGTPRARRPGGAAWRSATRRGRRAAAGRRAGGRIHRG